MADKMAVGYAVKLLPEFGLTAARMRTDATS